MRIFGNLSLASSDVRWSGLDPRGRALGRRGLLVGVIGAGATLAVAACSPAEKTASSAPVSEGPTPSETASASPSPSETEINENDPLSPDNLYAMTPEERLEAIRIPEDTATEDYPVEFAKRMEAIFNLAGCKKLYDDYEEQKNGSTTFAEDATYILDGFYVPMLGQLFGDKIAKNSVIGDIARNAAVVNYMRFGIMGETWGAIPQYNVTITVNSTEVTGVDSVTTEMIVKDSVTDVTDVPDGDISTVGAQRQYIDNEYLNEYFLPINNTSNRTFGNIHFDSDTKSLTPGYTTSE